MCILPLGLRLLFGALHSHLTQLLVVLPSAAVPLVSVPHVLVPLSLLPFFISNKILVYHF